MQYTEQTITLMYPKLQSLSNDNLRSLAIKMVRFSYSAIEIEEVMALDALPFSTIKRCLNTIFADSLRKRIRQYETDVIKAEYTLEAVEKNLEDAQNRLDAAEDILAIVSLNNLSN